MPFNPYMGGVNIDFVAKRKAILSSFFLLFGALYGVRLALTESAG